jgi:hypothetical protein
VGYEPPDLQRCGGESGVAAAKLHAWVFLPLQPWHLDKLPATSRGETRILVKNYSYQVNLGRLTQAKAYPTDGTRSCQSRASHLWPPLAARQRNSYLPTYCVLVGNITVLPPYNIVTVPFDLFLALSRSQPL